MTDKETIEALALQVEQLSEDVRGLTYTVQDLVAVIGAESIDHDEFGLKKVYKQLIFYLTKPFECVIISNNQRETS